MKKEFVLYEQALALKELGFDKSCFGFYNNADGNVWIKHTIDELIKSIYTGDFEAPLYQQAFRWFREKHNIFSEVYQSLNKSYHCNIKKSYQYLTSSYDSYKTYEEAELACLKKLIEIVKNNGR